MSNYSDNGLVILALIFLSENNKGKVAAFSVLYHCEWSIFGFWTVSQITQDMWRRHLAFWETFSLLCQSVARCTRFFISRGVSAIRFYGWNPPAWRFTLHRCQTWPAVQIFTDQHSNSCPNTYTHTQTQKVQSHRRGHILSHPPHLVLLHIWILYSFTLYITLLLLSSSPSFSLILLSSSL